MYTSMKEPGWAFNDRWTSSRTIDVSVGKMRLACIDLLVVVSSCWIRGSITTRPSHSLWVKKCQSGMKGRGTKERERESSQKLLKTIMARAWHDIFSECYMVTTTTTISPPSHHRAPLWPFCQLPEEGQYMSETYIILLLSSSSTHGH
jgi:hypothetical protein